MTIQSWEDAYGHLRASFVHEAAARLDQLSGLLDTLAANPADEAAKREKAAASVLALARKFKADGKTDTALTWFKKVVEQYPGTQAAEEAAQELE